MLRNKILFPLLLLASISLASCSGLPKSGPPPPGGNSTLSLTMTDTPLTGTSILSFKVTVTGVSLTPSTGKAVSLTLNPTTPIVELTRLQSDSAFLGTATVPSANYISATVSFSSPDIVLINQTAVALNGGTPAPCPAIPATTCEFKPATSGMITLTTAPFPLTLTPNQQTGLSLDFNLNNAITMTNGAVSVDFTQAKVLTAATLPRIGTPTGALDLIEDFTGIITTISGNSVTVHSDTRGNITAVANSSTTFNIDPTVCPAQNITCLAANKTVSIDASLNLDGTMTLLEADLLDNVSVLANKLDAVEGTVTSVNASQISLVLSDKSVVSGNSLLTAASAGTVFVATVGATPTFSVDTKGLSAVLASFNSIPFATLSNVFAGQTVRIQVLANPAPTAGLNSSVLVNTNSVVLRFSRVTATVSIPPASPFFSVSFITLPPFLGGVNGFVNIPVQISTQTNFDGVTDITRLSVGDSVSVRALYIPNFLTSPFFAAKVRKH
jgi:Domain of unknown function (DUF4382)/Domain of unknown function (DUF5666)